MEIKHHKPITPPSQPIISSDMIEKSHINATSLHACIAVITPKRIKKCRVLDFTPRADVPVHTKPRIVFLFFSPVRPIASYSQVAAEEKCVEVIVLC